ncbi:uncharacterized protein LOC112271848 isoform X2 [Brachypodium distachyon]|uniref:uncharacterized protein LOC112271848 isoform X2 n=1 Tax=Brachypodium distachyon TaxID=15368 RepID=UPI000D0D8EA5|nr:uncharacterized protein LOC112271848 isoform X2 [Brachypodium distachyon]|eukprot:XP_024317807.1 uncharacterized protein LOC112271848 isoform X2 [Brachypodium distachyon]
MDIGMYSGRIWAMGSGSHILNKYSSAVITDFGSSNSVSFARTSARTSTSTLFFIHSSQLWLPPRWPRLHLPLRCRQTLPLHLRMVAGFVTMDLKGCRGTRCAGVVRKKSPNVSVDLSDNENHPNFHTPTKKRRNRATKYTNHKKVGFKCSPGKLKEVVDKLSGDQREWVKEIFLGSLLNVSAKKLPRALTIWLVNQVNCDKGTLDIHNTQFRIKPLIHKLLGIPSGAHKVPVPVLSRWGKYKIFSSPEEYADFRDNKLGKGKKVKDEIKFLIGCNDKIKFQKHFLLLALCIYLAPSSSYLVSTKFLNVVTSDLNALKDLGWCSFVADYIIEAYLHGCR